MTSGKSVFWDDIITRVLTLNNFSEKLRPFICFSFDLCRMGFHLPPFTSVPHLHLHALSPASMMNIKSQLRYGPQSHWFITVSDIFILAMETGVCQNNCMFNLISIPWLIRYLKLLDQLIKLVFWQILQS